MAYVLGIALLVLLFYGPSLWVNFVLWRHSGEISDMPGTGGEFAEHLIERFKLAGVKVVKGGVDEDYYDPDKKIVSLSPDIYSVKSIAAVAVAAHEVGHAIQFTRNEPVSQLREKYLNKALWIKKLGSGIMVSLPLVTVIFKVPHLILIVGFIGLVTMLASALMYLAILPEEYDASFNKALPILGEGYVPDRYIPAARQVLRAAALTYFAAALADIVRLWRWLRFLR